MLSRRSALARLDPPLFYAQMHLATITGSHDLSLRCRACAHCATLDLEQLVERLLAKGLSDELSGLRFRCTLCQSTDIAAEPVLIPCDGPLTPAAMVEAIFHGNRAKNGKRRNEGGYGGDGGRRTMGRWWK